MGYGGRLAAIVTPDIKINLLVRRQNEPRKIVHQFTCYLYYCCNGSACTHYYLNAMIINYVINNIYVILYRTCVCVCIARNRRYIIRLIAVPRKLYSFFTHRKCVYKTKYCYALPPEWVIKTQRRTPPLSPRRQPAGLFYRRLGPRN